jgi:hypothetical protein
VAQWWLVLCKGNVVPHIPRNPPGISKQMKKKEKSLQAAFRSEVERRFGFLVDAGFEKPIMTPYGALTYESPRFNVFVGLSPREGVETDVVPNKPVEPPLLRPLSRGLACLYREAGLGSVNRITSAATSQHSLQRAVGSQADALEALLPILTGSRFDELMERCAGR